MLRSFSNIHNRKMMIRTYTQEVADRVQGFFYLQREPERKCILDLAKELGGPVLELACGAGRVSMELAKAGYEVYALDASRPMLEIGIKAVHTLNPEVQKRIHFIQGDMTHFAFATKFPLIVIAFKSFWILTRRQAAKCLALMLEHLQPQGKFFIDAPCIATSFPCFKEWWETMTDKHKLRLKFVVYYETEPDAHNPSRWYCPWSNTGYRYVSKQHLLAFHRHSDSDAVVGSKLLH